MGFDREMEVITNVIEYVIDNAIDGDLICDTDAKGTIA
jgi:hypothetical protein